MSHPKEHQTADRESAWLYVAVGAAALVMVGGVLVAGAYIGALAAAVF